MTYANSFGGDRYFPPAAGAPTGEQTAAQLPIRPTRDVQIAALVAGALRCTFTPAAGKAWLVRRITVQADITGRAFVYEGDAQRQNIVSGTRSGTFDENDTRQPIFIPEGSQMLVIWPSAASGFASARIEYVEV